ncbi:MAG: NAD-dependent epimerase/dehydratase family protein, partial [Verrucomicrobiaceae bacterium]
MSKRALITGITGQDGAYLAQFLLQKGYEIFGLVRRSSTHDINDSRMKWLGVADQVKLLDGDLTDPSSIIRLMQQVMPDELYNLGAQSFVGSSWHQPMLTAQVTAVGALNTLEAVRLV